MSDKKRFVVNCCGECPAFLQGAFGNTCRKILPLIEDASKIHKDCPHLVKKNYNHYKSEKKTYKYKNKYVVETVSDLRRPYPYDKERRDKCMAILAKNGYTQSKLAKELGISRQRLSMIITGRALSNAMEKKIASFFSVKREDMFPSRMRIELMRMYPKSELSDRAIKEIEEFFSEEAK